MADDISLAHIRDLIEGQAELSAAHMASLRHETKAGFSGVNARLDRVNGRLDKHDDRLGTLEGHQHRRHRDPAPTPHERSDDEKSITRRDVLVGVACSVVSIGVVLWMLEVMGKI